MYKEATLQNPINIHNHQCNGIQRPFFFFKDCRRLRSREVKGLLRTHRLVCVYIYIHTDHVRVQVALAVKNPPAHARDVREAGLILGLGRWRKCQPTPVFHLENPMDRGDWRATVHRVAKSQTRLSDLAHTLITQALCFKNCT